MDIIHIALEIVLSCLKKKFKKEDLEIVFNEFRMVSGLKDFKKIEKPEISDYCKAQSILAKINERNPCRKQNGVYYTPEDLVHFIVDKSFKLYLSQLDSSTLCEPIANLTGKMPDMENICLKKTVFDPACGSGEFVLAVIKYKLDILSMQCPLIDPSVVKSVVSTIYGNDLDRFSTIIAKIRIMLFLTNFYGIQGVYGISKILNKNFTSFDYISEYGHFRRKHNIILGNPPYVEDFKYAHELKERYGNVYANVLVNSAGQLENNGVLGFVVPLSYISTQRMSKLRKKMLAIVPEQHILSFADRPDCLFDSVHQKLCVIIGKRNNTKPLIYTSNYQYWYKDERKHLFEKIETVKNGFINDDFIPKLGNKLDVAIYRKLVCNSEIKSVYEQSRVGAESVYLNRRETFWMKAFREYVSHPEYKVFSYEKSSGADYCYCLINSSLFWWYWIAVSDCWHVSKDLNGFKAPASFDPRKAMKLATKLRKRLEETKVYVGTSQIEYEYKHRFCMKEIHEIDDFVNELFRLTPQECEYVKNFSLRYRLSEGPQC